MQKSEGDEIYKRCIALRNYIKSVKHHMRAMHYYHDVYLKGEIETQKEEKLGQLETYEIPTVDQRNKQVTSLQTLTATNLVIPLPTEMKNNSLASPTASVNPVEVTAKSSLSLHKEKSNGQQTQFSEKKDVKPTLTKINGELEYDRGKQARRVAREWDYSIVVELPQPKKVLSLSAIYELSNRYGELHTYASKIFEYLKGYEGNCKIALRDLSYHVPLAEDEVKQLERRHRAGFSSSHPGEERLHNQFGASTIVAVAATDSIVPPPHEITAENPSTANKPTSITTPLEHQVRMNTLKSTTTSRDEDESNGTGKLDSTGAGSEQTHYL